MPPSPSACDGRTEFGQPGTCPDLRQSELWLGPRRSVIDRVVGCPGRGSPSPDAQRPRGPKLIPDHVVTLCLVRNPRQAKPLTTQEPMVKTKLFLDKIKFLT